MDNMDRWPSIETRISRLETEFDNRISNLEKNLEAIRANLNAITENILDIKAMLGKQAMFNENIKEIFITKEEANTKFNEINIKLTEFYEWRRSREKEDEKFWKRYNGFISTLAIIISFLSILLAMIRGGKL